MKLWKSRFGMNYEMETLIQTLVIQINLVWNLFHGIIHELIGYAHALLLTNIWKVNRYYVLQLWDLSIRCVFQPLVANI